MFLLHLQHREHQHNSRGDLEQRFQLCKTKLYWWYTFRALCYHWRTGSVALVTQRRVLSAYPCFSYQFQRIPGWSLAVSLCRSKPLSRYRCSIYLIISYNCYSEHVWQCPSQIVCWGKITKTENLVERCNM